MHLDDSTVYLLRRRGTETGICLGVVREVLDREGARVEAKGWILVPRTRYDLNYIAIAMRRS